MQLAKDALRWRWFRDNGGWPDTEATLGTMTPAEIDAMADRCIYEQERTTAH